jgi:hypothetical protein
MQYAIAQQVANEVLGSPKDKVVIKVQGAVQSKYDDKQEKDVTRMTLNVDCLPGFGSNKVGICKIKNANQPLSH